MKVFIGIPVATTGFVDYRLTQFLLNLPQNGMEICFTCGHGIVSNRNKLVDIFLDTDCDYILFIDTDTIPPKNILDMVEHKVDICSGVYHGWIQKKPVPLVFECTKEGKYNIATHAFQSEELSDVDAVGAGCLLISRKVFDTIKKPYFFIEHDSNGYAKGTEDFYFCRKAKEAGFKIYVDIKKIARHIKNVDLIDAIKWKGEN